jgi:hypothetical protein
MLRRNDMALLCAVPEVTPLPLKRSLLATMLTIASPADADSEKMQMTGDLAQNEPVTYITNFAMISRAASRCHWHYYREGKQQTLYFYKARELVDKTTYVSGCMTEWVGSTVKRANAASRTPARGSPRITTFIHRRGHNAQCLHAGIHPSPRVLPSSALQAER